MIKINELQLENVKRIKAVKLELKTEWFNGYRRKERTG